MNFWDWIKTAGGIASAISACIALITLIIWKPVKKRVDKRKAARVAEKNDETAFRAEMRAAITELRQSVKDISAEQMESEKERIRSTVFRMEAECRRGQKHSLEEFRHVTELNEKYKLLLKKTGDTNGVFTDAYSYIMQCYHEARESNDFLI